MFFTLFLKDSFPIKSNISRILKFFGFSPSPLPYMDTWFTNPGFPMDNDLIIRESLDNSMGTNDLNNEMEWNVQYHLL